MDEPWELGQVYQAWEQIYRALLEAIKPMPRQTLLFLANRASDRIISFQAAQVLDWQDNRHVLPDWGWFTHAREERLRSRAGRERFRSDTAEGCAVRKGEWTNRRVG